MASDIAEREMADAFFGGGATTWAPATWYLALSTTQPNDDGTNFTEPVGGSYARVAVVNNSTNFPAAVTNAGVTTKSLATTQSFPTPTGLWGLQLYYGWFKLSTGDTVRFFNPLDVPITIQSGNTPVQFVANMIVMVFD